MYAYVLAIHGVVEVKKSLTHGFVILPAKSSSSKASIATQRL
jgi:hypothetical protein